MTDSRSGFGPQHEREAWLGHERKRTEHRPFYSTWAWRKLRKEFLAANPLCADCLAMGKTTAATDVHHIADVWEKPELALVWENLQALCHSCHSHETLTRACKYSSR